MTKKRSRMSPEILLRIYKRMKRNPNKVYILKDFGLNSPIDRIYTNTLVKLELIEEVDVIYKRGKKFNICKTTRGYKLNDEWVNLRLNDKRTKT